jgi:hypothetical protein
MCFLLIVKTTRSAPEGTSIRSTELEDARVHRGQPTKDIQYGTRQKYYRATQLPISFLYFFSDGDSRP